MMNQQQYVTLSLELHLFFGRIMKEHALFLEAGFTPRDAAFAKMASRFNDLFDTVLSRAVQLGNGMIGNDVLASGEIITDETLGSEVKTANLTGIAINTHITREESALRGSNAPDVSDVLCRHVKSLNTTAIQYLDGLIEFKTSVLNSVLSCDMVTMNYPLLIQHSIREARLYRNHIVNLNQGIGIGQEARETELFWNQIMMEHAQFIRGLLDPTESELIMAAGSFADEYQNLLAGAQNAAAMAMPELTLETMQETKKYRDFKEAGTKGINECKIRSMILPLLADHVLRESNHYLRLLKQFERSGTNI